MTLPSPTAGSGEGAGGPGGAFTLTLWTNDPELAKAADEAGIDRIGLDLETVGKAERQKGLDTWLSPHRREDLAPIRRAVRKAALFVRANPLHEASAEEVDWLVSQGAEILMLPSFQRAQEVQDFSGLLAGRAALVPLVERAAAVGEIPQIAAAPVEEIHVGLNDLSIDLGLGFRLAALTAPIMDEIAAQAARTGLRLGVGGIGRAFDESLPIPSDLVYAQLGRLGASGALLSRSFFDGAMGAGRLEGEVRRARKRLAYWRSAPAAEIEAAHARLVERLSKVRG